MTTAEMIRAHISLSARTFNPSRVRAARRRTPEQAREDEIWESWKRQLKARTTGYRDLRLIQRSQ